MHLLKDWYQFQKSPVNYKDFIKEVFWFEKGI